MESYVSIGIFLLIAVLIVPATMILGWFFRPKHYDDAKLRPYECGLDIHESPRGKVSIHFYVIAVVFLVFDVETVFLLPWAVDFDRLGLFGFVEVMVFLGLLVAAYAWVWARGALRWEE